MTLNKYTPRSNDDGDRVQARDLVGHDLIVNVREVRDGIVTQYKPDGGRGVVVAIHDLTTSTTYRDVLWMNNQIVDALVPVVGQGSTGIRIVEHTSKSSGRQYITVEPLDDATSEHAATIEATLDAKWWVLDDEPAVDDWDGKPASLRAALKPITKTAPAAPVPATNNTSTVDQAKALLDSGLDIGQVAHITGLPITAVTAINNL